MGSYFKGGVILSILQRSFPDFFDVINRYMDKNTMEGGNIPDLRENKNPDINISPSMVDELVDTVAENILDVKLDSEKEDEAVRKCARCSLVICKEVGYYRCVNEQCTMGEKLNLCELCYSLGKTMMEQNLQLHYRHMKLQK